MKQIDLTGPNSDLKRPLEVKQQLMIKSEKWPYSYHCVSTGVQPVLPIVVALA